MSAPETACRALSRAALTLVLVAALFFGGLLGVLPTAKAYTQRPPIFIDGDLNFTAANGVTGGSGTPSDPFLIEGWEIAATTWFGIHIRNTMAPFIARGNFVHSGGTSFGGIYFERVQNGAADSNTVSGNEWGFRVVVSTNVTLSSNTVSGNLGGIYLAESSKVLIAANVISTHVWQSISVSESTLVTISANQISDSQAGIVLSRSTHANLTGNILRSDGVRLEGGVAHFTNHTISPDNLVNGKPLLYRHDCRGLSLDSVLVGELIVANCTGVSVSNLDIAGTDVGIQMAYVKNATLTTNHLHLNDVGLLAESSSGIAFKTNRIDNNTYGLFLRNLTATTLQANNVSYNWRGMEFDTSGEAILLENTYTWNQDVAMILGPAAYDMTLLANNVSHNGFGISYQGFSQNVSILANVVSSNLGPGIDLGSTANCTIANNRITLNGDDGIIAGYGTNITIANNVLASNRAGVRLYGYPFLGPPGVVVRHNDFLSNTAQAFDDRGPDNAWDDGYPSGGNFWSDYRGVDNCSGPNQNVCPDPDDIGDVPYAIDGDSQDRYPLMAPRRVHAPLVTVTSPRGGEDWSGGTAHQVVWTMSDEEDATLSVVIELSTDGGSTFPYLLFSGTRTTGTNDFSWAFPNVDSPAAQVRICAFDSGATRSCDTNDNAFTLDSKGPLLWGTEPQDGAVNVDPRGSLVLRFSEPMNASATLEAISISPTVHGTMSFSWDTEQRTLTIGFGTSLGQNVDYVVSIACAARDESDPGNRLVGCLGETQVRFRTAILAAPPVAYAATVVDARVGSPVTLDGSRSTGDIVTWTWTIRDRLGRVVFTLDGPVVPFAFQEPGTFGVTLRVADVYGRTDEYSFNVVVHPVGGNDGSGWVLAAIAAAVIAFVLVSSWEPGRVALMTTIVGRIYGGKPKDEKDSEFRGAILYYVRVHPGDTYMDIKRNLALNDGVVTYHLARLEKEGMIRSHILSARKRYYPAEMRIPAENGGELHEIQQRILRVVATSPGMPVSVLAEQLGVSTQLALYHLRKLSQTQRVGLERAGLRLRAYPGQRAA